jgi:hypothetical protein
MKKCMTTLIVAASLLWIYAPWAVAHDVLRIAIPEAYLLDGPGAEYRLLCKVSQNEPLTLLSWEGDWFKVRRAGGTVGWLNRVTLSPEDSGRYPRTTGTISSGSPTNGSTRPSSGGFLDSIRTGFSGRRDDSLTASAGGRGIMTETDLGDYEQDYRAVHYMESIVVSNDELNHFIVSGGLAQ